MRIRFLHFNIFSIFLRLCIPWKNNRPMINELVIRYIILRMLFCYAFFMETFLGCLIIINRLIIIISWVMHLKFISSTSCFMVGLAFMTTLARKSPCNEAYDDYWTTNIWILHIIMDLQILTLTDKQNATSATFDPIKTWITGILSLYDLLRWSLVIIFA